MNEDQLIFVEGVANTLRGMTMDMRVPADTREVLMNLAAGLDDLSEYFLEDEGESDYLDPDLLREDRDERARLAREDKV